MDATRDQLWGQLLLERRLMGQAQLQQLVSERDERLRLGQDASIGQLLVQKRWLDVARFGALRSEIEGRGRACLPCGRVFLAPNPHAPPTCPTCGRPNQLPPPAGGSSGKFQAQHQVGSGRFQAGNGGLHAAPTGSVHSSMPASGRMPASQPHGGAMGGSAAFPQVPPASTYQSQGPGSAVFRMAYPGTGTFPAAGFGQQGPAGYGAPVPGSGHNNAYGSYVAPPPGSTAPGMDTDELETGELGIGKRFGNYEIVEELGRGGMGVVYKATDPRRPGSYVAMKVLLAGEFASPRLRERFREESRLASRLRHPNIVPVHDIGEVDSLLYYTMDFVEGQELQDMIRAKSLPIRRGVELLVDVARAAHHAHDNGVVHRDLKPSNILVANDGTPYIMDFGLAKNLEADKGLTKSGVAIGTPYYMPPEQARGHSSEMDARSDVYAIGAILYEIVTRKVPFTAKTQNELLRKIIEEEPSPPRQVRAGVPADLETICLKALSKEKDKRYESALDMAEDMERFLSGEQILAKPPPPWAPLIRKIKRNKQQSIVIASAVLAVLIAIVVIVALRSSYQSDLDDKDRIAQEEEEKKRQELVKFLVDNADKGQPPGEAELARWKKLPLPELQKVKDEREAHIARLDKQKKEQRKRLQSALTRGQEAYASARSALSSADARASFERAESEYSEARAIEQDLKEERGTTIYRRAVIRRALCKWKPAAEDFRAATRFPPYQARGFLALAVIKLRVDADRPAALKLFKQAQAAEKGVEEADAGEEQVATLIAKGYVSYLGEGYRSGRDKFLDLFSRGKLGGLAGDANGALAYIERVEGKPLGKDEHASRGLRPSRRAVGADKYRFEFLVDRAILLARSLQVKNAAQDAVAARHAARDLDLDGEWADVAAAVIAAATNKQVQMRQAIDTALTKARNRSPASEQVVQRFVTALRKAVRDKEKEKLKKLTVTRGERTFRRSFNFGGAGRANFQIEVGPDVVALLLLIRNRRPVNFDLYVGPGTNIPSLASALWKAKSPGPNETLLIRRGGQPGLRPGIFTVAVVQPRVRGRPQQRHRVTVQGKLIRQGEQIPWVWESFAPLRFPSTEGRRVMSIMQTFALLGLHQKAIKDWEALERRCARYPSLATQRADFYEQIDAQQKAYELLLATAKKIPKDPRVIARLGLLEVKLGKTSSGLKRLEALYKAAPRNLDVVRYLAQACAEGKKQTRAMAVVEAADRQAKHPKLLLLRAEVELIGGDSKKGVELLRTYALARSSSLSNKLDALLLLRQYSEFEAHQAVIDTLYRQRPMAPLDIEKAKGLAEQGKMDAAVKRMMFVRSKVDARSKPVIDQIIKAIKQIKPRKKRKRN